jgi:small-conductance mechanosensitive channel
MREWLQAISDDLPHTWRPLAALLVVAAGVVAGKLAGYLLKLYARRVSERTGTPVSREHVKSLGSNALGMMTSWAAHEALLLLDMPQRPARLALRAAFALAVIFAALLARRLVLLSLQWYAGNVSRRTSQPVDPQFLPLTTKITSWILAGAATVVVLQGFGYNISTLIVSLGIGSLAIGLAMQATLANMIAGFTIMLDRPFRIGDRISLSTGEIGEVEEIGLRSTRIVTNDRSMLIVPNTMLVNDRLLNHSYPTHQARLRLSLSIAYGADLERVRRLISEILAAESIVLKDPAPAIQFSGFGEWGLKLLVQFSVADYREDTRAVDAVGAAILKRFKEEGINIPPPVRTLLHGGGGGAGSAAAA